MKNGERKRWKIQKRGQKYKEEILARCIICLNGFQQDREEQDRCNIWSDNGLEFLKRISSMHGQTFANPKYDKEIYAKISQNKTSENLTT